MEPLRKSVRARCAFTTTGEPLRASSSAAASTLRASALFTIAPIDESDLLLRQGITAPQGLESLSDLEWDDETDAAYLAALLSK